MNKPLHLSGRFLFAGSTLLILGLPLSAWGRMDTRPACPDGQTVQAGFIGEGSICVSKEPPAHRSTKTPPPRGAANGQRWSEQGDPTTKKDNPGTTGKQTPTQTVKTPDRKINPASTLIKHNPQLAITAAAALPKCQQSVCLQITPHVRAKYPTKDSLEKVTRCDSSQCAYAKTTVDQKTAYEAKARAKSAADKSVKEAADKKAADEKAKRDAASLSAKKVTIITPPPSKATPSKQSAHGSVVEESRKLK